MIRKYEWRDRMMQRACKGILAIVGIQLEAFGTFSKERPLLVVSNHLSYMDIILLASRGQVYFTPKSEIAKWPVIGYLCKITGCVFVDRRPAKIKVAAEHMRKVLESGKVLSIFPEATTGGGVHMLPFKSSFFNLAEAAFEDAQLHVQPVALTYTKVSNLPVDLRLWHKIAWYGDTELVPHVWEFLKLSPIKAQLHFLPPVTMENFDSRKELAAHCHKYIEAKINSIRSENYQLTTAQKASKVLSSLKGSSK